MKNSKNKKLFIYMVAGALVMALYVSCSNDDKTGVVEEVNISQYAGIYASDTPSYRPDSNSLSFYK